MERFFKLLREHAMIIIHFEAKKKNDIKNIVKLESTVTIQGNMKVLHVACVIQNIVFLKKFL